MQPRYKKHTAASLTITGWILELAKDREVIRPRDLTDIKNPGPQLRELVDKGVLLKVGHGLYTLANREPSRSFSISQALGRVPSGVLCLISALEFHGFTTQIPYEVWLAVGDKRPIKVKDIPVRIVRMSSKAISAGVEEHGTGGTSIRVFSAEKTIADCFKFRRLVGLDVALEALREGWRTKKFKVDELMNYARIDRVEKLIRPYLEMLIA
jgi:predicted transcriptional regulator of viral defense system